MFLIRPGWLSIVLKNWYCIISLLVAAVGVFFAFLAYKASWDIAEMSGGFDKAEMVLKIGGHTVGNRQEIRLIQGAEGLGEDGLVFVAPIPFSVGSVGRKTLDDVGISFRYHKSLNRALFDVLDMEVVGPYPRDSVNDDLLKGEGFDYMTYSFARLHPGGWVQGAEPIYLHPTRLSLDVPVTTADGVEGVASIDMGFAIRFMITLSARDIAYQNYNVTMEAVSASSMDELIDFAIRDYVARDRLSLRGDVSLLGYLGALFFNNQEREVFLLYSEYESFEVEDGEGALMFYSGDNEVVKMSYKALSWAYLL